MTRREEEVLLALRSLCKSVGERKDVLAERGDSLAGRWCFSTIGLERRDFRRRA